MGLTIQEYEAYPSDEWAVPVLRNVILLGAQASGPLPVTVKLPPAILDTGADFSLLPWKLVSGVYDDLEPGSFGSMNVVGITGNPKDVDTILLRVQIKALGKTIPDVRFAILGEDVILGRDFLNKLDIFYRGPDQRTLIFS